MNDKKDFLKEASKLINTNLDSEGRRRFLKRGLTTGGVLMLTGCDINDNLEDSLIKISKFNDRVQSWLFDGTKLAATYGEDKVNKNFPFNAYYSEDEAPYIDGDEYKLELSGLISDKRAWTLEKLYQLTQINQITRHICVEGWSEIGKWGGVSFSFFLKIIGADTNAEYVSFKCSDDYYTSIDMETALHPQTLMALTWDDKILPRKYGYPIKIRIPTKLGYKNPKHIQAIEVTNRYTGGYWEDQGYNWFGGS